MKKPLANICMWVALDRRGKVQAAWARGYKQPFRRWKSAVKGLGLKPVHVELIGNY